MPRKRRKILFLCSALSCWILSSGIASATGTEPLDEIMEGLSSFKQEKFAGVKTLELEEMVFSVIEMIYGEKINNDNVWWSREKQEDVKNIYSMTDWNKFIGMYETVELTAGAKALLTEEVRQYESLLDMAAEEFGFKAYKELFKAIAQARFNENKLLYQKSKKKGVILGNGSDRYDLFAIDGSWLVDSTTGGKTPVGAVKAPIPTPTPTPVPTIPPLIDEETGEIIEFEPIKGTPTPMPSAPISSDAKFTVKESINIAANAFAGILQDACWPSPYEKDVLVGVVEGFEFGGDSGSIRERILAYKQSLPGYKGFISFPTYYNIQKENTEIKTIIDNYAKIVAHGKTRSSSEAYGKYRYSDQKFYEKVFEVYETSGSTDMDFGQIPSNEAEILKGCMQSWGSEVTAERQDLIQQGVLLYGVKYSMDLRNSPSYQNPKYLDCSSFVGQCFWRAKVAGTEAVHWCTGDYIGGQFHSISHDQLIPGDVGLINTIGAGGSNHVGIYIGNYNGKDYFMHCSTGVGIGGNYIDGVRISTYSAFKNFYRHNSL